MKVNCRHGFFIFEESSPGQVSNFMNLYGLDLTAWGPSNFTFSDLAAAPDYSLVTKELIDRPAIVTFSGEPWQVFEANGFVYDFNLGNMVPISSVVNQVRLQEAGNYYVSNGLILPGSLTVDGDRIKSYAGFESTPNRWLYSEVTFV